MSSALKTALRLLEPAALRVAWRYCAVCGQRRLMVRLADNEIAIRCCSCRASVVSMSIAAVVSDTIDSLSHLSAYELSARGPLLRFLQGKCKDVTCSEYFPGVQSGLSRGGILCQDVQSLSFADCSFDLCTSTDVFEHVPDDQAGFAEICRVLRPGGKFIFTVPLQDGHTVERAVTAADGSIRHLLPPEYHGDPIGESGQILAYRNYGPDICNRLLAAGFSSAALISATTGSFWGITRQVIVAAR